MSEREKRLATFLGIAVAGLVGWRVVWPAVRNATVEMANENRRLQDDILDLQDDLDSIGVYQDAYKEYLARTGNTNPDVVRDNMHAKLMALTRAANLSDVTVTPKRPGEYKTPGKRRRKTDIRTVGFTIRGDGQLKQTVEFLKSFYELPYVAQITDLKIVPKRSRRSRRGPKGPDLVSMTATIESLVPPTDPLHEINPELLTAVDSVTMHGGKEYAMIWKRDPFKEYVKPPPPPVRRPDPPKQPVKRPDPPKQPIKRPDPPPPPPPPVGDPERTLKQVRMTLLYGVDEVLVVNPGNGSSEYVGIGDQLDGGEVLMVHSLGPITRREDEKIRFYPLGMKLAYCVEIDQAGDQYPEVVYAFDEVKDDLIPPEPEKPMEPDDEDDDDEDAQEDERRDPVKPPGPKPSSGKSPTVKPSLVAPSSAKPSSARPGVGKVDSALPRAKSPNPKPGAVVPKVRPVRRPSRDRRAGGSPRSSVLFFTRPFGLQSSTIKVLGNGAMPDPKLLNRVGRKTLADVIRSTQNRGTTRATAANRARKVRPGRNTGRSGPAIDKKTQR